MIENHDVLKDWSDKMFAMLTTQLERSDRHAQELKATDTKINSLCNRLNLVESSLQRLESTLANMQGLCVDRGKQLAKLDVRTGLVGILGGAIPAIVVILVLLATGRLG